MQEIQFLELLGGSNVLQAFPNYLIFLHFIRMSTVVWKKSDDDNGASFTGTKSLQTLYSLILQDYSRVWTSK